MVLTLITFKRLSSDWYKVLIKVKYEDSAITVSTEIARDCVAAIN